ncbi:MAG: family 43 glycosylhydrolase [Anaerolineae bacterium]
MLRNPLNQNGGADPWLTYYDGYYYLAATTWASNWTMRKSETLAGLKTAEPVQIYFETDPSRCCNMWAPEFRLLDGPNGQRWYFYYTAGTAGTYDNQRSYVLESASTDPMGPYAFKTQLHDPQGGWSIDGSVLELDGSLYFLFSAFSGGLQSIFIAPMSNPWTISGERVLLSRPEYPWEMSVAPVNEGPVALQHDGDTFIVFSASACSGPDYKLGILTYNGGDPLSTDSWVKSPEPVFQRSDANGVFAPGHNGFFKSPDGTEDWIVYHANDSVGYGCDGRRSTRVQKITWNADGTPDFGIPLAPGEPFAAPSGDTGIDPLPEFPPLVISRFKSFALDAYLRHADFFMRVSAVPDGSADAQFFVRQGLADPDAISIESVNFPGFFLRHQGNTLVLSADDTSDSFAADATWWIRDGLADSAWMSFESYNLPNSYIGRKFGVTVLIELTDSTTDVQREDATFREERNP